MSLPLMRCRPSVLAPLQALTDDGGVLLWIDCVTDAPVSASGNSKR